MGLWCQQYQLSLFSVAQSGKNQCLYIKIWAFIWKKACIVNLYTVNRVFPKWSRTFNAFSDVRESDKSLSKNLVQSKVRVSHMPLTGIEDASSSLTNIFLFLSFWNSVKTFWTTQLSRVSHVGDIEIFHVWRVWGWKSSSLNNTMSYWKV